MAWGRIQTADGRTLSGMLTDTGLQPMAGFGSTTPAGPVEALDGATLLAPCQPG